MERVVHITNFGPREAVTDGGGSREEALASFLAARGAQRIVVQDEAFRGSRRGRLVRSTRLLREVEKAQPDLVVMNYPAYPLFWQFKATRYSVESLLFAERLWRLAGKRGFRVVIDVMDVPVFQYEDLGFRMEMRPGMMKRFDRFLFNRADMLWVCSESLVSVISREYGVPSSRMLAVLNGYVERPAWEAEKDTGCIRFGYAGSLNRERGIEPVLESFAACEHRDMELHLCGRAGDWIGEMFNDPRVVYHGELTDEEASKVMSACDVGLIPYPEHGYYNLAFATKLGFYLGQGLPVLCSNAAETAGHVKRLGVGVCRPIDKFGEAMAEIARRRDYVAAWRERVLKVRGEFSWPNIYGHAFEETVARFGAGTRMEAGCK